MPLFSASSSRETTISDADKPRHKLQYKSLQGVKLQHKILVDKLMTELMFAPEAWHMVSNIYNYCKLLPRAGATTIDKNIFVAQLFMTFGLQDALLIDRMYHISKKKPKDVELQVEDFARVVCIFVTDDIRVKARFVFMVYNNKHITDMIKMSSSDIYFKLKHIVAYMSTDHNGEEGEESLKEVVDMTIGFFDANREGFVNYLDFEKAVIQKPLLLQCLGPCLPDPEHLEPFKRKMCTMTEMEVLAHFRHERRKSLRHPNVKDAKFIQQFYPIDLELPGNM